jgi:hypothetical protein
MDQTHAYTPMDASNSAKRPMKTLKCDLCDHEAQGETFEAWMKALMPHYMEAHADVMKATGDMSKEDQQKEQRRWMADNHARFEAA